jgi:hypothetical protein
MRRPTVISEWKRLHRMASVQLASLCAVFGLLPVDQQTALLDLLHIPAGRLPAVMGLAFIVARLWAQPARK